MVTSQLIVLSFLVVAASSSFLNFSTLRTTNNNDIQSNAAFSGGYNRYDDFGGGGWGGSPQTSGKLTHSCESPTSANVRGKYSSLILPCAFTFHKSTGSDDEGPFSTSTVCSDDNHVNIGGGNYQIMDYVQGWGDECVGDYTR